MDISGTVRDLMAVFAIYLRSNPRKVFLFGVAGMVLLWGLFGDYGVVSRIRLEVQHHLLLERHAALEQDIALNRQRVHQARTPEAVEKVAREKYNFRKPGETLFILRQH
ncbi:FtsB family cell division protein [Prosthecochloris sp. CIB 2401]|uniref:FtsB family cell division protein n=1 Tax=Prosthecochloris sp. CIB 2401 TaxID=1868325 RepID=UPI00080AA80A|nr:septum formation initiator family protein [Prosthecochloris sp. CIB 2401]ANT64063.1 Septum formation initiator [Prosthecochloris sp. CIB 2401]